eukprot:UN09738
MKTVPIDVHDENFQTQNKNFTSIDLVFPWNIDKFKKIIQNSGL